MSLTPPALVRLIFDTLVPQQEAVKLWHLMSLLPEQMYSRLSGDHDEDARRVERIIFQACP